MSEQIAVVTGATRGVGRGIAVALGAAGWTVWVTGRSSSETGSTSHLPGTVEEAAEAVTLAGGRGVAQPCDHTDDVQVRALFARIERTHGALDLLVNNVWGGYERLNAGAWDEWIAPFWQQPFELWDKMFTGGVRAHYTATALAAPLLAASAGTSLVITISMELGARHDPQLGVAYSMAKAADHRLAILGGRIARLGCRVRGAQPGFGAHRRCDAVRRAPRPQQLPVIRRRRTRGGGAGERSGGHDADRHGPDRFRSRAALLDRCHRRLTDRGERATRRIRRANAAWL